MNLGIRTLVAVAGAVLATACVAADPPAAAPSAQTAANKVADDAGKIQYGKHCLTCHQADGYGVPNLQPAIVGGTWVGGDPRALAMFVLTGGFDSASRKDGESDNVMPAFARLSDEDLADMLTFIRAKFGKGASAVSPADVAAARENLPPTR